MAAPLPQPQGTPVAHHGRGPPSDPSEDGLLSGAVKPNESNRHSLPRQPCALSTLHYEPPPDTL